MGTHPVKPQNVKSTAKDATSVSLAWAYDGGANTTFSIYRDDKKIAENIEEMKYKDEGLKADTTYNYQVVAVTEGRESEKTEQLQVKTNPVESGDKLK